MGCLDTALEIRVEGLGIGDEGFGAGVSGFEFRVSGLGLGTPARNSMKVPRLIGICLRSNA